MGRFRKHPNGYTGILHLMYNRVCLKEGHSFRPVCKDKDCSRIFGRHIHNSDMMNSMSGFRKNSKKKFACEHCGIETDNPQQSKVLMKN